MRLRGSCCWADVVEDTVGRTILYRIDTLRMALRHDRGVAFFTTCFSGFHEGPIGSEESRDKTFAGVHRPTKSTFFHLHVAG